MGKETIDVSMTQQVGREREGKRENEKLEVYKFDLPFLVSLSLVFFLFQANREDQEGTKAVFAHTF